MMSFQIGALQDRLEYWRCRSIDFRDDVVELQGEVERSKSILPVEAGYGLYGFEGYKRYRKH